MGEARSITYQAVLYGCTPLVAVRPLPQPGRVAYIVFDQEIARKFTAEADSRKLGLASAAERESNIPLGRLALPDDVAAVAAFLASDEAAYMTGQAINATGGLWMN